MRKLVFHPQTALVAWVCGQLDIKRPGPATAIGVMGNHGIIAGAMFNNLQLDNDGKPLAVEISFVAIDKRWSTRSNIKSILSYPYIQLGVKRVQAVTAKRNMAARRFLEHIGFKFEGIGRMAWPKGGDAACYSMLRHECKWLEGNNGQIVTIGTSGTGPGNGGRGTNRVEPTDSPLQLRA